MTDDADVARLLGRGGRSAGGIDTLINVAGGARGADKVADAKTEDWEWMFEVNVLGTMKLIRAFLPMLRACGEGTVLNLTSTAGCPPMRAAAATTRRSSPSTPSPARCAWKRPSTTSA